VDRSGNVTISNLTPPPGVRVTGVTHESTGSIAGAEALHKYAQKTEVRDLAARVARLERAGEDGHATPPPASPPPANGVPPSP